MNWSPLICGAVAHGRGFVCGLTTSGAAYCWGDNAGGELGTASTTGPEACLPPGQQTPSACSTVRIAVAGARTYASITLGGQHACALTAGGSVYCWGDNAFGQLGDGTATDRSTPVQVTGEHTFVSISAGDNHTCGLISDGTAYCWGNNTTGALGNGAFTGQESTPIPVSGSLTWSALAAAGAHTCALAPNGAAYCWGLNDLGQLGTGTTQSSASPIPVVGGLTFANLTAAGAHSCGVTATTSVAYCWGSNSRNALGNDDTYPGSSVPVRVEGQP